jgi:hypothetical protein
MERLRVFGEVRDEVLDNSLKISGEHSFRRQSGGIEDGGGGASELVGTGRGLVFGNHHEGPVLEGLLLDCCHNGRRRESRSSGFGLTSVPPKRENVGGESCGRVEKNLGKRANHSGVDTDLFARVAGPGEV